MEFASPGVALALLGVTLLVALLGVRILVESLAARAAVAERSALELAEKRAARLRYRLNRRLLRRPVGEALNVRLASAGIQMMLIDFASLCLGAFLIGTQLANLVMPLWLAILIGGLCARLCVAWIERQRERRRLAFIGQLPEIARILSNASSAGLAIRSAIEMAASELDEPASTEMAMVAEELSLGQSVERALTNLERRMPSRDVGVLISTLVIQQRSGGDLVRALQDMADTLDSRRDLNREIRTVMAGSVFTGYLVAGIGVVTLLFMNLINPGVIDEMTSSFFGFVTLIFALSFYVVGFLLIRRVTKIEV